MLDGAGNLWPSDMHTIQVVLIRDTYTHNQDACFAAITSGDHSAGGFVNDVLSLRHTSDTIPTAAASAAVKIHYPTRRKGTEDKRPSTNCFRRNEPSAYKVARS